MGSKSKRLNGRVILVGIILGCMSITSRAQQGILNNAAYSLCFTPGGQCTQLIVQAILSAKKYVEVQAYSFTSNSIIQALVKMHQKGIDIFILLDKSNIGAPYSVIDTLNENHIPYLIDTQPEIAHNKVLIIDNETVMTGSFNFTKAAQNYYAENVLIIHDADLAEAYHLNFLVRKQISQSIQSYCQPVTPMNAQMCHQQDILFQNIAEDDPWHRTWKRIRKH